MIDKIKIEFKETRKERIAYLKGITKYTIWADSVPGGDKLCDDYQEELERLEKEEVLEIKRLARG